MESRPLAPREIIDPVQYAGAGYPHEAWAQMRRDTPVAWCEVDGFPAFWAITRYDDIVKLSKDPQHFISRKGFMIFPKAQFDDDAQMPSHHVLNMDPPEHRDYRATLSHLFTPRSTERWRPMVERVVDDIFDRIAGRDEIDFVTEVSAVMPIAVIAAMLGIPPEDHDKFFRWTNQAIGPTDPEYQEGTVRETAFRARDKNFAYFAEMVRERRAKSRDDMVSVLVDARVGGEPIPDFELLSFLFLLVVAGNETTRNAATGGYLTLLEHPEQLALLRNDRSLLRPAVEEVLRWTSPVIHMARTATEDVVLHDVKVRAGERVTFFYPSANRDESIFEAPDDFRVERWPNRHLAFGVGEHVCLGAHLARLELQVLLDRLVDRVESAELVAPPERLNASIIGGIKHAPLKVLVR